MTSFLKDIKERFEMLRVGQAIYCKALGVGANARVTGVGQKWIYFAGGRKCEEKDILD